jgi:uncharacterized protein (TIGR02145 family)
MKHSTPLEEVIAEVSDSTFIDSEGNVLTSKVMKDGKQWLTENLSIKVDGSYCYDDSDANCHRYGRLYTWEGANEACKMLGRGWRLPTYAEWREMIDQYGGIHEDSGSDGKEAFTALIEGGGSGFNVVFGGNRDSDGHYRRLEAHGFYWTGTETGDGILFINFGKGSRAVFRQNGAEKLSAFSIRCIKD